jgi:hypothetical protein
MRWAKAPSYTVTSKKVLQIFSSKFKAGITGEKSSECLKNLAAN